MSTAMDIAAIIGDDVSIDNPRVKPGVRGGGIVMDETQKPPSPSLADEHQGLTRSRIRSAAMEVVARRGFDATVSEIAEVSGVSPRTIFRHYASHDRVDPGHGQGHVRGVWPACERTAAPTSTAWLEGLAVTIHTRNAEIIGEAFWDIHAPSATARRCSPSWTPFDTSLASRGSTTSVRLAWGTAGGTGDPPVDLVLVFAFNFSAFATQALMIDFDQTPAQIGMLTADIVKTALHQAVARQR